MQTLEFTETQENYVNRTLMDYLGKTQVLSESSIADKTAEPLKVSNLLAHAFRDAPGRLT